MTRLMFACAAGSAERCTWSSSISAAPKGLAHSLDAVALVEV
jgi:hypothetical protein